jgi:hypothetical protein
MVRTFLSVATVKSEMMGSLPVPFFTAEVHGHIEIAGEALLRLEVKQ